MLHGVDADQRACSAESSLAMDRHGSRLVLGNQEELPDDALRWCAAVNEEQVGVLHPILNKSHPIVLRFVESNNSGHVEVAKHLQVVFRSVATSLELVDVVQGSHECDELAGNDPVEVTVLDFLVVLVLLVVKIFEAVPAELDGVLQALQAVLDGAGVGAVERVGSVSERHKLIMVWLKQLPDGTGLDLQHDNHKCAHQEGGIGLLIKLVGTVMKQLVILVLRIAQQSASSLTNL